MTKTHATSRVAPVLGSSARAENRCPEDIDFLGIVSERWIPQNLALTYLKGASGKKHRCGFVTLTLTPLAIYPSALQTYQLNSPLIPKTNSTRMDGKELTPKRQPTGLSLPAPCLSLSHFLSRRLFERARTGVGQSAHQLRGKGHWKSNKHERLDPPPAHPPPPSAPSLKNKHGRLFRLDISCAISIGTAGTQGKDEPEKILRNLKSGAKIVRPH